MSAAVVTAPQTLRQYMDKDTFRVALLDTVNGNAELAGRLKRVAIQALARSIDLQECTVLSIAEAVIDAATVGLEPGNSVLSHCYLIPRKYNDDERRIHEMRAVLQVSYRGKIELSRRSGLVRSVEARAVHANDIFKPILGTSPRIIHKLTPRSLKDPGPVIAYYAIAFFKGKNAGFQYEVMSHHEIELHRTRYAAPGNKAWNTAFDEMAKKTVVHRLEKYLPLSPQQVRAHDLDEEAETYQAKAEVIDFGSASAQGAPVGAAASATEVPAPAATTTKKRSRALAKAQEEADPRLPNREAEKIPAAGAGPTPATTSSAPTPQEDGPGPCEKTEGCMFPNLHLGVCRPAPASPTTPPAPDGKSLSRCTLAPKCHASKHEKGCPQWIPT